MDIEDDGYYHPDDGSTRNSGDDYPSNGYGPDLHFHPQQMAMINKQDKITQQMRKTQQTIEEWKSKKETKAIQEWKL